MNRNRTLAAVAMTAATLTLAAPAHAEKIQPNSRPVDQSVFWTAGSGSCWKGPDSRDFDKAPMSGVPGLALEATRPFPGGAQIGGASGDWVYVENPATGQSCYAIADWVSESLPESLDEVTWDHQSVVAPAESLGSIGKLLSRDERTLFSGPTYAADAIGEVEDREVVTTSGWSIAGGSTFTGVPEWVPVRQDTGAVAWLLASSTFPVPAYDATDLTATITPQRDVEVLAAPGINADALGVVPAGTEVSASLSATLGWLPVVLDGQVGWVDQATLAAEEEPLPSATPTEPSLIDRAKDALGATDAEKPDTEATPVAEKAEGWWAKAKARVTGDNPVVEAVAKPRLYAAGGLAVLALLLAGLAHAFTLAMRGRTGVTVAGRLTDAAAPGLRPLLVHGTLPAAVVAGLVAAALAPSTVFVGRVLAGAVAVGGVIAYAAAHRVAVLRGAGDVAAAVQAQSTGLLLVAGGAAAGLHWGLDLSPATSIVLGLAATGILAGFKAPRPVQPVDLAPYTPTPAPSTQEDPR